MRRLLATLLLAAFAPGAVLAQSISSEDTDVTQLITFTVDSSVIGGQTGAWASGIRACSSFRAVYTPVGGANSAQFELHAVRHPSTTPDATTLIQAFTAQVNEPGDALNATGKYFILNITRAQVGADVTRLTLRCSNAAI